MINAGKLRHQVTFKRQTAVQDEDTGQRADTWTDLDTVRAEIIFLMGSEFISKSGEHSDMNVKFRCRYAPTLSDLNTRDKITFRDVDYDIGSVVNWRFRNKELIIMAKVSQSGD